jgi:hypothetical protein
VSYQSQIYLNNLLNLLRLRDPCSHGRARPQCRHRRDGPAPPCGWPRSSVPVGGAHEVIPTLAISFAAPLKALLLLVNIGRREPTEIFAPPRRPTPPSVGPSPGAGEVATECSPRQPAGVAAAELLAPACEAAAELLLLVREAAAELRAPSSFGAGAELDSVGAWPGPAA